MNTRYKHILIPVWLVLSCSLAPVSEAGTRGPGSDVVISQSATPTERRAGILLESTGFSIQKPETELRAGQSSLHVGPSLASMTLVGERVDWGTLGPDGVVIVSGFESAEPGSIVLAGGRPRGTAHAVVRFLEDQAGCRWWPDGTHLYPPTNNVPRQAVPLAGAGGLGGGEQLNIIGGPAFTGASMWPSAWALKDPAFGREPALGGDHYISLAAQQLDKPHTHADGSLCLSDETTRGAVAESVRQDLEAAYPKIKRVVLGNGIRVSAVGSREDKTGHDHSCEVCDELIEKSGSPAGVLLGFGNTVAKAIAEDYPDARIALTFEGMAATPPRGIRAEDNVVIRWVHDPYIDGVAGEHRAADWPFLDQLRGWAVVGGTLELVEPLVDGRDYLAPQGGLYDLGLRLRQAKAMGVKHVDFLGAPNCDAADWLDLRKWVAGHLGWDPTRDTRGLAEDYMTGYYGDAGLYLVGCLDRVRAVEVETGDGTTDGPLWRRLTLDDLNAMADQFDLAEQAVAHDQEILAKVRKARLPLIRIWLERYSDLKAEADRSGTEFKGPANPEQALEGFLAEVRGAGTGAFQRGTDAGLNRLKEHLIDGIRNR